ARRAARRGGERARRSRRRRARGSRSSGQASRGRRRRGGGCAPAHPVGAGNAHSGGGVRPPMDLDVVLPNESPSMPVGALRDLAREAEDLGFAPAWLHVLPPGPYGPEFGGVLEPLVTI